MAYSTQSDIEARFSDTELINVTDENGDGRIDTAKITTAIEDADSIIDDYLRGRYEVPLTTVPHRIKVCSVNLAIYILYAYADRRSVPEENEAAMKEELEYLKSLKNGFFTLQGVGLKSNAAPKVETNKTDDDQVFDSDLWEQYGIE